MKTDATSPIRFKHEPGAECDWVVEFWDDQPFPLGIAYVKSTYIDGPLLYLVEVQNPFQRRGIATSLIRACQSRWPDLEMTEPVSEAGEKLLDSIRAETDDPDQLYFPYADGAVPRMQGASGGQAGENGFSRG